LSDNLLAPGSFNISATSAVISTFTFMLFGARVFRPGALHGHSPEGRMRVAWVEQPGSVTAEYIQDLFHGLNQHLLDVRGLPYGAVDPLQGFHSANLFPELLLPLFAGCYLRFQIPDPVLETAHADPLQYKMFQFLYHI
jgi:hypothetical protein